MKVKIYVPTKPLPIYISDHALIRYMERVQGVDFEKIRSELRTKVEPAVVAGARSLRSDGMEFVLDGHRLVTVQPRTRRKKT